LNHVNLGSKFDLDDKLMFPTVNLGIGGDKISIIEPPYELIEDFELQNVNISKICMKNCKRVEKITKQVTGIEPYNQKYLFKLISNYLLMNPSTSLDDVLLKMNDPKFINETF
jgi:hypothetical protein